MADKLLFLTTADTEILATASAAETLPRGFPEVRCANPGAIGDPAPFLEATLPGTRAAMVRLLGGGRAWPEGFDELRRRCGELGVPLLAFGGEAEPDAELTALSTAPSGVVAEAFEYLRRGGVANTENLLRFVADTLLFEGYGFEPPSPVPELGVYHPKLSEDSSLEGLLALHDPGRPTVGVVFYRTHLLGGNTAFVDALVEALEGAGANALPVYCYSLRRDEGRRSGGLARVGGPGARGAWSSGGAGHLHDLLARGVARVRRRALAARRRLAGRDPRVRRQDRLGTLLLQGEVGGGFPRRSPLDPLRGRPRAHR